MYYIQETNELLQVISNKIAAKSKSDNKSSYFKYRLFFLRSIAKFFKQIFW